MSVWPRWMVVLGCCLMSLSGVLGCGSATSEDHIETPNFDIHQSAFSLEHIASGLDAPLAVTHAGDDRLFIVERPGRLRIWRAGELVETPFLDIVPLVLSGGEQGFFSVAFHPNYGVPDAPGAGLFWVNYTNLDGDTVIARYAVAADDPDRADPSSARILLTIAQPFGNHNGGQLQFGPPEGPVGERYLYIGMGDGGSGGDPFNHAQRADSLLGKMLRVDPSTEPEPIAPFYAIPPDNPRLDALAPLDSIWAIGLRNPWRFSFDATTGDLYIGDVGQSAFEEIHITAAETLGEVNYGWRLMEGNACFNPRENCDNGMLARPAVAYPQTDGRCAVIGGYVYRGVRFPVFNGHYFYADYCSGDIFGLEPEALSDTSVVATPTVLFTHSQRPLAFGEDVSGELYLMDEVGDVYRMVVE